MSNEIYQIFNKYYKNMKHTTNLNTDFNNYFAELKKVENDVNEGKYEKAYLKKWKEKAQDQIKLKYANGLRELRMRANALRKIGHERYNKNRNNEYNLLKYYRTRDEIESKTNEELKSFVLNYADPNFILNEDEINLIRKQLKNDPETLETFNLTIKDKNNDDYIGYYTKEGREARELEQYLNDEDSKFSGQGFYLKNDKGNRVPFQFSDIFESEVEE